MNISELHAFLGSTAGAEPWLTEVGVQELSQAHTNFIGLIEAGFTFDLLATVTDQLEVLLPSAADPDMAISNLRRFVSSARSPIALGGLIERDSTALPILLKIFSSSQYFSDLLIEDPAAYDLLRLTDGMPVARQELIDELTQELRRTDENRSDRIVAMLRRFQHRELLRIAYGDLVHQQPMEMVASQLSYVAEAICVAAFQFASRYVSAKRDPATVFGHTDSEVPLAVIAAGGLGASEMDYAGSIELLFVSGSLSAKNEKELAGRQQFLVQVAAKMVDLLTSGDKGRPTAPPLYTVATSMCGMKESDSLVAEIRKASQHLELVGGIYERLKFVRARPIAGAIAVAEDFISRLQPWIYPKYFSAADTSGIRSLRRTVLNSFRSVNSGSDRQLVAGDQTQSGDQAESGASSDAVDEAESRLLCELREGLHRIRDVELSVGLLQVLHGPQQEPISPGTEAAAPGNTPNSIEQLHRIGCLNRQEADILRAGYSFFRKLRHHLQVISEFHQLPDVLDNSMVMRASRIVGYRDQHGRHDLADFRTELSEQRIRLESTLEHLLGELLQNPEQIPVSSQELDVTDLLLLAEPDSERIEQVLTQFGFHSPTAAWKNLLALSREKSRFLSSRRCRHFLANILPTVLKEIAATPDPDDTLEHLAIVSDSLGGKGLLWELFSLHPASLRLFVRICATTRYLTGILNRNPGMIDELMDSLMVADLPQREAIFSEFARLTDGAEDPHLIMKGICNSNHLKIGVRDVIEKDDIRDTHRALAVLAEACLDCVARKELTVQIARHGRPMLEDGRQCEMIMLAMGRLGGREPNYHSDLDVVFVYEGEGFTGAETGVDSRKQKQISNDHFFNLVSTHISRVINSKSTGVRLYELDSRLRPGGSAGPHAISLHAFLRHFKQGRAEIWERLALCKARPMFCRDELSRKISELIFEALVCQPWNDEYAEQVRELRYRIQQGAAETNLKRGVGGVLDIELTVQFLQLKHLAEFPELLVPGTLDAIDRLRDAKVISQADHQGLVDSCRFLRKVESRLRLLDLDQRHNLPGDHMMLRKLAYLMNYESTEQLVTQCDNCRQENRARFLRMVTR